jgi:type I restriction enzyme S subunit
LPGREIDKRFLFHFLREPTIVKRATSLAVGINLPRLSPSVLERFEIPIPPLKEQYRLVDLLDRGEALRGKRHAALAELDSLTQAIFLDMFGDAVSNEKRWPTAQLASLVRDCDSINYGVVQPGDDFEDGVPLIRVGDLKGGHVEHSSLKRIDPRLEASYSRSSRLRKNVSRGRVLNRTGRRCGKAEEA